MRISRKLTALGAFFVLAVAIAGCGSSIPSNSVASVAGNPILTQAYKHWMFVAAKQVSAEEGAGSPVITASDPPQFTSCITQIRKAIPTLAKSTDATLRKDCQEVFAQYNTEVMNFLIEGYWYQAEAAKLGISYTAKQEAKDFAALVKKNFPTKAALTAYLTSSGETQKDITFTLRVSSLYTKLSKRFSKPVTKAQIATYYAAHKATYGTAESVNLHLIRTADTAAGKTKAQAAYNALKSGQSWDSVAKTYAADASAKANGGLLTGVVKNEEEKAVNTAIFSASANQLVGPIHGLFGYYVLEVVKITPATQEPLSKVSSEIKTLLTEQQGQSAEAKVEKEAKAAWGAKTLCRTAYSVPNCHGYKAPATTTTATPTPTTSATTTTSGTTTTAAGTTSTAATTSTATSTTNTATDTTTTSG